MDHLISSGEVMSGFTICEKFSLWKLVALKIKLNHVENREENTAFCMQKRNETLTSTNIFLQEKSLQKMDFLGKQALCQAKITSDKINETHHSFLCPRCHCFDRKNVNMPPISHRRWHWEKGFCALLETLFPRKGLCNNNLYKLLV